MRSSSHITAETIITAIIDYLFSINIFQSIGYIAATAFYSIFPDIDHTHSLLGRILRPIRSYLVHSILDASTLNGAALSYTISKRTCVVLGILIIE